MCYGRGCLVTNMTRVPAFFLLLATLAGCTTSTPPDRRETAAAGSDRLKIISHHCNTAQLGYNGQDALNACTIVVAEARSYESKGKALNNRGLIYARTGRSDAALADFGAAVDLMVDPASAYANRADIYRASGRYDLMIADLESARWVDEANPETYSLRSRILSVDADYGAALPLAEKSLILGFNEPRGYDALGHALMGLGRAEEAEDAFVAAIERGDAHWLSTYQYALARKGYDPGRQDGVMDDATRSALRACIHDNCRLLLD